ncbi:MAG: ribonuclease H [Nitrospira sp.]|nr:ribonuclease H [bacterium]MBL7048432.1 ribonuclease H [Nitrospira sp.]
MHELILLTDGSVDTKSNIGYGAYLAVPEPGISPDLLKQYVQVKCFKHTSSTRLELQTLLWALNNIQSEGMKVTVYTDSQNIMSLPGRRERLEQNNYRSKQDRLLKNHDLYQEFYRMIDNVNCKFIKVSGHRKAIQKDYIDRLFTLVDRASRNALRKTKL